MTADKRDLLEVLKSELDFLEKGGYRKVSWRPQFIFEDSPTCLNYGNPEHAANCSECVLMHLVPPDKRQERVPCRFIPLSETGETVESLYRTGTEEEVEAAVRNWLTAKIESLQQGREQPKPALQA
jgi:hypothetical protein